MNFTVETWREQAGEKLAEIGARLKERGRRDAPYAVYGALAGLTLWPAVEQAVTTGQFTSILPALYGIGAAMGGNLIGSRVEQWMKASDRPAEADVIAWAEANAADERFQAEMDAVLEKLDAVPQATAALAEAERADFLAALRDELARLGNLPAFQVALENSGAFIGGAVTTGGGAFAGRDMTVEGDYLAPGATKIVQQAAPGDDPEALRHAYLSHVFQTTAYLSLGGVDPRVAADAEARLHLASVYTALLTGSPRDEELAALGERASRLFGREERRQRSAVEELDRHDRLVLLGDPGSGKSTFANFVTLCLAGEALGNPATNLALLTAPLPDEKGEDEERPQPWRHGALLPVRVILRDFAAAGLLPEAGSPADAEHLWRFLQIRLEAASLGEFVPHLRRELRERGGLLILDGLDEAPEAESRRAQIKQVVERFAAAFPRCRVLITSRTYAYQKQEWRLPGFDEAVLAPFSPGQIRRFVDRWYDHIGRLRDWTADDARGRGEALKRAIEAGDRLQGLAERPLLLTLMASLHAWRGGSLPEKREELYADTVDLLLDWWESQRVVRDRDGRPVNVQPSLAEWLKVDRDRVRELLNRVAYEAHAAQPELSGAADIPEKRLVDGLLDLTDNPEVKPRLLVQYLSQRAGLLVPHGVGVYTFPHRTFQEYLAACYLTDHDYPDLPAALGRADRNRWREVVLLAAAKAARGAAFAAWSLAEALCPEGPDAGPEADNGALLAGLVLCESADLERVSPGNRPKVERARRRQIELLRSELPAVDRAAAGRSLAALGDDRPEIMDVDAMQFCLVPGGDFRMGSDEREEEQPLHTNPHLTYDYWMGRYPISNAQFAAFVADKGYERKQFWPEAVQEGFWSPQGIKVWGENRPRKAPVNFGSPYNLPNHPVVGISWYEALGFARWLTARWRDRGLLPQGWGVVLPSEAEWEKAARGGLLIPAAPVVRAAAEIAATATLAPAAPELRPNPRPERRFPWGDEPDTNRLNSEESAIGATSALGAFPAGRSIYGCEEMSGNVWEWTRSLWGKDWQKPLKYPYTPDKKREDLTAGTSVYRVIRGGSFYYDVSWGRCAQRYRFNPNYRFDHRGARVLVAPFLHL